jgi:type IV pilus assembly protein PilB
VPRIRIGDLLLSKGLASEAEIQAALAIQKKTRERLGAVLVNSGVVSEFDLLTALSELLDTPIWDLVSEPPTDEVLALVPSEICAKYCLLPVKLNCDSLLVAMLDVDDLDAIDALAHVTKKHIKPVLVSEAQLSRSLLEFVGEPDLVGGFVDKALEIVADSHKSFDDVVVSVEDTAPVINLVNQIMAEAIGLNASDVHMEPRESRVDVRFRMDGLLHVVKSFPTKLLPMVVARIKIMAELDIVENRLPQDGRFTAKFNGKNIDVRVSVLPNSHGQRIVLRILDGSVSSRQLEDLGFSTENGNRFRDLINTPYGMVLVTGPTGSGKTTTLYASINQLRDSTKNIMTCEDPIEYNIDGINQSQIHEKIGLSFAAQLRAMLRQDPDVVLVGEIRDTETLETAIRASMTGHLVLSTLHCNDAIGALPRMFDMGAEPYLLSTSLLGVTAQRLIRRLCPGCREEIEPSEEVLAIFQQFGGNLEPRSFRRVGCSLCNQIGIKGRIGIHEVITMTPELSSAIASRAPVEELNRIVAKLGYTSLREDALRQVSSGETSIEEAKRLLAFGTTAQTSSQALQIAA